MKIFYFIFLILMLAGNCFGFYQLITLKQQLISRYPALTDKNYSILIFLPVLNIIGLAGMLFFKSWSPYLALAGAFAIILADIYFGIRYHLWLAIPSAIILVFLVIRFWDLFK